MKSITLLITGVAITHLNKKTSCLVLLSIKMPRVKCQSLVFNTEKLQNVLFSLWDLKVFCEEAVVHLYRNVIAELKNFCIGLKEVSNKSSFQSEVLSL